jgi:putative nucleotidyltransferase with HDIG domain
MERRNDPPPRRRDAADTLEALIEQGRAAERAGAWDDAHRAYDAAFVRLRPEHGAERAVELLRWIGTVFRNRGELENATELYEASLAVAELNDFPYHVASALNCLAIVSQFRANIDEAEQLYRRASVLAQDAGDDRLAAMIDQNVGTLANTKGSFDDALEHYRSALRRFRRLEDEVAAAWVLNNMGMAHVDLGQWANAVRAFDEAFDLADRQRDTHLIGTIELNRAELHLKRGSFDEARDCCDRAFEVFNRVGSQSGLGEAYKFYGVLYREMGKQGLADTHLKNAIDLAVSCEDRLLEAEAQNEAALLHLVTGDNRTALQRLNRAHLLFTGLRARAELLDVDGRLDRLEETFLTVVKAWGESIESKDRYTAGHCERVADYACMLAQALGFEGRDLTWIRMGGFLHDVGKIVVPPEILNKRGKLSDEEFDVMKSHTTAGDEIVAPLNFPYDIRPMVRNHHERWDGNGYPDRLAGEDIPLTARILCVADVYDALTTARSYRPALPLAEALRIMEREAGIVVDPAIFVVFRRLILEQPSQRGGVLRLRSPGAFAAA